MIADPASRRDEGAQDAVEADIARLDPVDSGEHEKAGRQDGEGDDGQKLAGGGLGDASAGQHPGAGGDQDRGDEDVDRLDDVAQRATVDAVLRRARLGLELGTGERCRVGDRRTGRFGDVVGRTGSGRPGCAWIVHVRPPLVMPEHAQNERNISLKFMVNRV